MTRILERTVIFRCEEHLCNTMVEFAKKHKYKSVSILVRNILVSHFMNIMLKETPELSHAQARKIILKNIEEFNKIGKKRKKSDSRL